MADGMTGWVAVNLSPQSVADPGLPDYLRGILDSARLTPGSLVLEMPEAAVFKDTDAAADLMWELKNAGAAIALDDFGVGATSFARLKRLPIDILKLHPQFVGGIGGDEGDEHLVEATIAIAHGIRAKVLAKGVEKEEQVEWLRDLGCDFVQGYLVGAPVPAGDLGRHAETA
jgi:EAL domain-containing protein (putative c-di-GMP-specific phosphodiesterase class I)